MVRSRLVTASLTAALIFCLTPWMASATSGASIAASVIPTPSNSTTLGSVRSIAYSQAVPAFPAAVSGYRLRGKKQQSEIRLFQGDGWQALSPMDQSIQDCGAGIWIVRWRSANPDVLITAALGDTALPGFSRVGATSTGNAGYMVGRSCVSPGLRFAKAIINNGSNLVDVDYEYEIWLQRTSI